MSERHTAVNVRGGDIGLCDLPRPATTEVCRGTPRDAERPSVDAPKRAADPPSTTETYCRSAPSRGRFLFGDFLSDTTEGDADGIVVHLRRRGERKCTLLPGDFTEVSILRFVPWRPNDCTNVCTSALEGLS
eukprot:Hpha_TRINITY_DN14768_c0_g3::TRINITY_DN14768_c0_g3_i1::g.102646::m.102646